MKKFILIIFLLFINLSPNAFAEPKAMLNSTNGLMQTNPYVKPDYTDTRKYIQYYIDDELVGTYNRFNHSYTTFYNNRKFDANMQKILLEKNIKNASCGNFGKYLIIEEKEDPSHPKNYLQTYIYDLSNNELIIELTNVKNIQMIINKDIYFFFIEKNDGSKWIVDKNGIITTRTKNLFHIAVSHLDNLYTFTSSIHDNAVTKFKINTLMDLAEIIDEIEQNNLKSAIEIKQHFTKKGDKRFFSYTLNRMYNFQTKKYQQIMENQKTKEYEDIREFYHYYLIKENGLFGVMNKNGTEIITPKYDAILVNDENNIELCNNNACSPHYLNEEKQTHKIIKTETNHQAATSTPYQKRETTIPKQFRRFRNYEKIEKGKPFGGWVGIKFPYTNQKIKPLYERIVYVHSEQRYRLNFCTFGSNTIYNENGHFKSNGKLDLIDWLLVACIFIYRAIMISLF